MAREIEILVELYTPIENARSQLQQLASVGVKATCDLYFFDPMREQLQPDDSCKILECFRLRSKGDTNYMTYKKDHYNGDEWLYSDEHEITISSFEEAKLMLNALGFKELVTVDNSKSIYKSDTYEIVLEEVKGLGNFLEIEALNPDDNESAANIKSTMKQYLTTLGLDYGEELNSGKPELLLRKNAGQ